MNVLILGPQGAGKGTQAKRIAAEYGVPHIASGDLYRAAIASGSELGRPVDVVFDLQVPDRQQLLDRLLKRAAEENRSDDTPEAIQRRLELYEIETAPLIEYYRTTRGNVVGIHADRSIEDVFHEIAESLEQVQARA